MIKRFAMTFALLLFTFPSVSQASEENNANAIFQMIAQENEIDTARKRFAYFLSLLANLDLYFEAAFNVATQVLDTPEFTESSKKEAKDSLDMTLGLALCQISELKWLQEAYEAAKRAGFKGNLFSTSLNLDLGSSVWRAKRAASITVRIAISEGLSPREVSREAHRTARESMIESMLRGIRTIVVPSYTRALPFLPELPQLYFSMNFMQLYQNHFSTLEEDQRTYLARWIGDSSNLALFPNRARSFIFGMGNPEYSNLLNRDLIRHILVSLGFLSSLFYL